MTDRIQAAIRELECATDIACDCSPWPHNTSNRHIDHHIAQALALLKQALRGLRCDNCSTPFAAADGVYLIQKGNFAEMSSSFRIHTRPGIGRLLLCPRCYDNNWIIGEPDDV